MAWNKTTWANLIGTQTTSTEVAPSGTIGGDIDTHGANKYVTLAVRCSVLFDNAPNQPTQIDFLPKNTDDSDTDPDTLAMFSAQIPTVTTSEEIATYQLNVSALDQLRVFITNLDTTQSVWVNVTYQAGYPD